LKVTFFRQALFHSQLVASLGLVGTYGDSLCGASILACNVSLTPTNSVAHINHLGGRLHIGPFQDLINEINLCLVLARDPFGLQEYNSHVACLPESVLCSRESRGCDGIRAVAYGWRGWCQSLATGCYGHRNIYRLVGVKHTRVSLPPIGNTPHCNER
jgi:hypothetical protein